MAFAGDAHPGLDVVPPKVPFGDVLMDSMWPVTVATPGEGLSPPQVEDEFGFGPGPPVLSGSVALDSLLSSSCESDFFPEDPFFAADAAAAARSCLRNFARLF